MNARVKTIVIVGMLLVVSLMGLSFYNYKTAESFIVKRVMNKDLPELSDNIKNNIKLKIIPSISLVTSMGNNYFLKQWLEDGENDIKQIKNFFKNIQDKYDVVVASMSSNQTYNQYTQVGVFTTLHKSDPFNAWYYSFIDSGKDMSLNITVDELRNFRLLAFINHIIRNDKGEPLGLATIGLDMSSISEYILKYITPHRNVYLINKKGYIIAHKDRSLIYVLENEHKNKSRNIKYISGINTLAEKILSSNDKVLGEFTDKNNDKKIVISNFIPSINSYLIIEQDENNLFSQISSMFKQNFIVSTTTTLITLLFLILILSKMSYSEYKEE